MKILYKGKLEPEDTSVIWFNNTADNGGLKKYENGKWVTATQNDIIEKLIAAGIKFKVEK
jgi:hypothetical protein